MDKIIFENFVLNPTNFVNPTYIAIQTNPTLSNENTTKINCGKSPPKFIMVRKFNACVIKKIEVPDNITLYILFMDVSGLFIRPINDQNIVKIKHSMSINGVIIADINTIIVNQSLNSLKDLKL